MVQAEGGGAGKGKVFMIKELIIFQENNWINFPQNSQPHSMNLVDESLWWDFDVRCRKLKGVVYQISLHPSIVWVVWVAHENDNDDDYIDD